MKRLKTFTILLVIILVIIPIYTYSIPKEINTKLQGVIFRLGYENQFTQEAEFKLSGEYRRFLFDDDLFIGKIKLDGHLLQDDSNGLNFNGRLFIDNSPEIINIILRNNANKGYRGTIGLNYYNDSKEGSLQISSIYVNKKFDKICLTILEKNSWNTSTGIVYAAPAMNRKEGLMIAKEYIETPNMNPLK